MDKNVPNEDIPRGISISEHRPIRLLCLPDNQMEPLDGHLMAASVEIETRQVDVTCSFRACENGNVKLRRLLTRVIDADLYAPRVVALRSLNKCCRPSWVCFIIGAVLVESCRSTRLWCSQDLVQRLSAGMLMRPEQSKAEVEAEARCYETEARDIA